MSGFFAILGFLVTLVLCWLLPTQVALSSNAEGGEFDYSGSLKGPHNWGDLKAEWLSCNTGCAQSPVDINLKTLQSCPLRSRLLQTRYNATKAVLTNLDHDVGLEFPENAGTMLLDGTLYKLTEYHIHSPSEHSISGIRYSMEGHLVHKSSDGRKIAVISVLYEIGKHEDAFIGQVEHLLPALIDKDGEENAHLVDPSVLNIACSGKSFYRYMGSLTTPPCTEGVTWSILEKPQSVSKKQFELLRAALKVNNTRSLQQLNGREVTYYKKA